jgi:hypothetical protein
MQKSGTASLPNYVIDDCERHENLGNFNTGIFPWEHAGVDQTFIPTRIMPS